MRNLILVLAVLSLSGCGYFDRKIASLTGYANSCIGGVMYYQFTSGVTVAYNKDGSIKTCGG